MVSVGKNAAKAPRGQRQAVRILMADDNHDEFLLMSMAAEAIPTPVVFDFVPDGKQLLTELYVPSTIDGLPNVIILDLRMPGFDGMRTLTELAAHPMFWQIPVVVFTSSSRRRDEKMCLEAGAILFENKPNSFSETAAFLERVISVAKPTSQYIGEASHIVPEDRLSQPFRQAG